MKIKAVCEITKLTDRTIRFYIEEGLVSPSYTENYMGRRTFDFTGADVKVIQDIAVLRKYGFNISEIREMINNPQEIPRITRELEARKQENVSEETELLKRLNEAINNENNSVSELAEFLSKPVENKPTPKETASNAKIISRLFSDVIKIVIALLPIIAFAFGTYFAQNKYCYLTVQWGYVIIALITLVPSFVIFIMPRMLPKKWMNIVALSLCVVVMPFSFASSVLMTADYSKTTNCNDCFVFDDDLWSHNNSSMLDVLFIQTENNFGEYSEGLGEWPPAYSSYYYYYERGGLDGPCYDIYAEFPIEQENLEKEIVRISAVFENEKGFFTVDNGDWTCFVVGDRFRTFAEIEYYDKFDGCHMFAYNEKTMRVRYIAWETRLDNSDPPYYISLDW